MKSPCKDCLDRSPTCHAACEAYNEYRQKCIAEREWKFRHGLPLMFLANNISEAKKKQERKTKIVNGRCSQ